MRVAFFIGVHRDQGLAQQRILEVRQFYPDADILSISDGVMYEPYAQFCAAHDVTYMQGERLKLLQFGGAWTKRRFEYFISQSTADLLIKIDPDTKVQKTVEFPAVPVFAPLRQTLPNVGFSGCVLGTTRATVTTVLKSQALDNPRYMRSPFGYEPFGRPKFVAKDTSREKKLVPGVRIALEDAILTDVFRLLKIEVADFPAVLAKTVGDRRDPASFAFVHPSN